MRLQPGNAQPWVRGIVVHHSASPESTTVEQIGAWHAARGFADVGYHYVVRRGKDGPATEHGRPEAHKGAHTLGLNGSTLGVCVAGNYSDQHIAPDMWAELIALLLDLLERYPHLSPDDVMVHRATQPDGYTECPGLLFPVAQLRPEIRARLAVK